MDFFSSSFFSPVRPDPMDQISPDNHLQPTNSSDGQETTLQHQHSDLDTTLQSLSSSRATRPSHGDGGQLTIGDVDTNAVDVMLSRELEKVSFSDRNAIHEEVHGVRNLAVIETPLLIERSLQAMQVEIHQIHPKPAYDHAVMMHSHWVLHDSNLKLRFLRTERFNVQKAAGRFVRFWDLVLEYYGAVALQRPIRMSDLGKEEMELLRSGEFQLLPFRDRSGRRIICCAGRVGLTFSLYARVSPLRQIL